MTFEEILPAIIIIGYFVTTVFAHFGNRVRKNNPLPEPKTPPSPGGPVDPAASAVTPGDRVDSTDVVPTADRAPVAAPLNPAAHRRRRFGTSLVVLAWLVGIAVTIVWLLVAVGVQGLVVIVTLLFVIPFLVVYLWLVIQRVIERKTADKITFAFPYVLLGVAGACFLLVAAVTFVNGLSYFVGLAYEVDLHVTEVLVREVDGQRDRSSNDTVSGWYLLHGAEQVLENSSWWSFEPLPREGTVVDVALGPIWPYPLMAGPTGALVQFLFAVAAALPGGFLTWGAVRERKQGRASTGAVSGPEGTSAGEARS